MVGVRIAFQRFSHFSHSPSAFSTDRTVPLTNQARAFRQIKNWIERAELDLRTSLSEVLVLDSRRGRAGQRITRMAAELLSFMTEGSVPDRERGGAYPISSLAPVFYERTLDCFFMRFAPAAQDEFCPELMIHVVSRFDVRAALQCRLELSGTLAHQELLADLLKTGLLTWSKLLPDNSRSSWEKCLNEEPLVANFVLMQRLLADSSDRLAG